MFIPRSPPLTRQRARNILQQQNEHQNTQRPHNTANTENVLENSVVDGEILRTNENMDSAQIRNALLDLAQPIGQNDGQRNGAENNGNEEHRGGLRMRFRNVGTNNGRENWLVGDENRNDGHRNLNQNLLPRTSTPISGPIFPELLIQNVHQSVHQNLPNRQNMGDKNQQHGIPKTAMPQPQVVQQPIAFFPPVQQAIPGPFLNYPAINPLYQLAPLPIQHPNQQMIGFMNTNVQNPPQMQNAYNPQFQQPYLHQGNHQFGMINQAHIPQVVQPISQPQQQPINAAQNLVRQNAENRPMENVVERGREPGMDQVAYALIMNQIPMLKGNEGAEKFREFFKRFDSNTGEWTNAKRISSLESKVFGRAERAFRSACSTVPFRYESIKREMLRQLEETDAREWNAFDQLMSGIRRKNGEDLDDLADRIITLVRRAYPGLTDHLVDDYAIKHLIRTFESSELALSLEMGRRPGMTFDQFVGMAARAEATQKATRRIASNNAYGKTNFGATLTRQGPEPRTNFQHSTGNRPKCFYCEKEGHIARNCFRRQAEEGNQNHNSQQNHNVTGANKTPLLLYPSQSPAYKPEPNNVNQQRPQNTQSRNFLRQNYLVEQKDLNHESADIKCAGVISNDSKMLEFFQKFWKQNDESFEPNSNETSQVGKIIAITVTIFDQEAPSMMDSGAQISLVQAIFLKELFEKQNFGKEKMIIFPKTRNVVDVNGKRVECYGIISLPVARKDCEPINIQFHITDAPIGLPILLGTNALGPLGFKIFDSKHGELIEFECASEKSDSVRLIHTIMLEPYSTKLVELSVSKSFDQKNVLIASIGVINDVKVESSVGKVRNGKVFASITNFSLNAIILKENEKVAVVETVDEVANAEDCLTNSWLFDNFQQKIDSECRNTNFSEWTPRIGALDSDKAESLEKVLLEFKDIFAFNDNELTQTEMIKHHIDTGEASPVKKRMRPVPYAYREKVATMIQDYLGRGIIRPSLSPWSSPIVIVPKKDGSLRFCVDYRGLNAITKKDCFPLPNIERTLLMLGGRKFFSTLDFISGYWQIKMDDESTEKTAFVTEFGLHEFTVMPFGLCNAVATFQRFMSHLFGDKLNDFVFVYIDDVLVASETFEQHLEHLKFVFEHIKEAGLKLKVAKCQFCTEELQFLGHVLTRNGIKMDDDKVKPILDMPTPKSKKELHSFLGFMTYYRKFIYSFGSMAAPLFKLLKKDVPFKMDIAEIAAISKLKGKILSDVVLYFPDFKAAMEDPTRKFLIMTDASKTGISAVLCQPDQQNRIRPIYFASRQCNKHESRYCPTELEALAVRFGVKKFAQYITMIPTRVLTDHKALIPMFKSKNETGNARVDKWIMELSSRFILEIEYNPGKTNIIADVLSRSGALKPNETAENKILIGEIVSRNEPDDVGNEAEINEWIAATKKSEFSHIYEFLGKRMLPEDPRDSQRILDTIQKFTVLNGLLYFHEPNSGNLRLFVPKKFRTDLIEERHEGKCAGHLSGKKIFGQLAENYFWPNMRADCINAALKCRICAHTRRPRSNVPQLKPVITSEPFELVCMDILSIGMSENGNKYVLVMVDHFTKYLITAAIPDKSVETVAKAFIQQLILIFGSPKRIHSDKGTEFVNKTFEEITKILRVERSMTAGYDPNANGQAERANQTILNMLKRSTESNWSWDDRLPFVTFAYNIAPSETTGFSPFTLLFGRPVKFPSANGVNFPVNPLYTVDEESYLQLFRENLQQILMNAKVNADKAREKMENWFNSQPKVTANKYKKGERVMVLFPGANQRVAHKKLKWNIFGPYEIMEISTSSAKVVPVDKKSAEPISVPVERLIHVPDGIPNISTVPRGKNAYKNLLNAMTILKLLKFNDIEGLGKENLVENRINSSGTMNNSGEVEEMDTSRAETQIKWTNFCDGTGEHILCKKLIAADLDPVLDKQGGVGPMIVTTPLQGLITIFILRSNIAMAASKELLKVPLKWSSPDGINLLQAILNSEPDFELIKYVEERGDSVRSGCCPGADEVELIWHHWASNCAIVHDALKATGYGQIKLDAPIAVSELPEADRIVWQKVFDGGSWALEKVRAAVIHGKTTLVQQPRVIIGDSSGAQLCGESANQIAAHFIGTTNGSLGDVIRALDKAILTTKVVSALIILGRDALVRGETMAQIVGECERIRALCSRFAHVRFIWIPPPYVREQHAQYNDLLPSLESVAGDWFLAFTEHGRSLVELWRFGDTFDMSRVRADGKMLPEGLKCLRAWIFTQIPQFPDDNSLGIRRPSRSVPSSVSTQLSELSITRSHNHSREVRVHPYSVRPSFHNSRGRRDGRVFENRRRH